MATPSTDEPDVTPAFGAPGPPTDPYAGVGMYGPGRAEGTPVVAADWDPRKAQPDTALGEPDPTDLYPTTGVPYANPDALKLTSIAPTTAVAGAAALTVTLTGTGFVSGAVALVNGIAQPATFVSATSITTQLTPGPVAAVHAISARNPTGRRSNSADFTVTAAVARDETAPPSARTSRATK